MNNSLYKFGKNKREIFVYLSLVLLMFSFSLNMLKLNTFSLLLFSFFTILSCNKREKFLWNIFGTATTIYFFIVLSGLLHTVDFSLEFKNIESKLSLILLPIIFGILPYKDPRLKRWLLSSLLVFVIIVSGICLISAIIHLVKTNSVERFFYHELLLPFNHHAIFFSVGVYISLLYVWMEKGIFSISSKGNFLRWMVIAYLFIVILLLSSKLIILFTLASIFFITIKNLQWKRILILIGLAIVIFMAVFSFKNPISARFYEITNSQLEILKAKEIGPEVYLNGLEFRLLQWRNTFDILERNDAWLTGMSFSQSKTSLWDQYDRLRLYSGEVSGEIGGYYLYDLHNQYLQTTLQFGLIGLVGLLFLIGSLIFISIRAKDPIMIGVALLFFFFCFTESLLERQYGLILFIFIPLLLYHSRKYIKFDKRINSL